MKERNITIDKKQIPSQSEPATTVLFHGYCKKICGRALSRAEGSTADLSCDDVRVPDECARFREACRYLWKKSVMWKHRMTKDADFVIYNTCTVRENANNKVYGRLGYLHGL